MPPHYRSSFQTICANHFIGPLPPLTFVTVTYCFAAEVLSLCSRSKIWTVSLIIIVPYSTFLNVTHESQALHQKVFATTLHIQQVDKEYLNANSVMLCNGYFSVIVCVARCKNFPLSSPPFCTKSISVDLTKDNTPCSRVKTRIYYSEKYFTAGLQRIFQYRDCFCVLAHLNFL